MIRRLVYLAVPVLISLAAWYVLFDRKIGTGSYQIQKYRLTNWPDLPGDLVLGNPTGLGINSQNNLVVFHRADRTWPLLGAMPESSIKANTVLFIDRKGRLINSWGANRFIMPHGLTVDHQDNIWLTDVGLHQVFKFSSGGRLLMTLGEAGVSGKGQTHFNRPTDVAVASDGSFYVSDGYGNSRVVKFSAEGKYLFEWGTKGTEEGEFHIPHSLSLDQQGAVYVADRENNRVQVFDGWGKLLKQIAGKDLGNLTAVKYDTIRQKLIATDDVSFLKIRHIGSDVIIFDGKASHKARFGRSGYYQGRVCWYHDVEVDKEGNIYAADILGNRVQKFEPIP